MSDPFDRPDDPPWMIAARHRPYPEDFIRLSAELRRKPIRPPSGDVVRDERHVKADRPEPTPRRRK